MKKSLLQLIPLVGITLFVQSTFSQAPRKVLIEDETGTWCGYCVRGTTTMSELAAQYPNFIFVGNHVGDGFENSYTKTIDADLNTYGYPGGLVNRTKFPGQTDIAMNDGLWESKGLSELNKSAMVDVLINSTYNSSTRALSVTLTATLAVDISGLDLRFNCVLTEDSVVNTADPQSNYLGNGCSSPDPSSPWYNFPCKIPNFAHRYLLRTNLSGIWGSSGIVLPASAGAQFTKTFNYTVPATWNTSKMQIVGFVSLYDADPAQRQVLNANKSALGSSSNVAIPELLAINQQVTLYQNTPNPFNDFTAIQFLLTKGEQVSLKIYNILGQEVTTIVNEKLNPGKHTFYWGSKDKDDNVVPTGLYFYKLQTSTESHAKQLIYLK